MKSTDFAGNLVFEGLQKEGEVVRMLEVTEKATEKLKEYLEERELESAIRIFVSQIG